MPTPTYTPLANITLGSSAASVIFSSINQGFRDLVLVINAWQTTPTGSNITLNGDSAGNYSNVRMSGTGSATSSASQTGWFGLKTYWTTAPSPGSNVIINFLDYSATDKHKTILTRSNDTVYGVEAWANRWASTAGVTSITIPAGGDTWAAGSTFSLYGIAA